MAKIFVLRCSSAPFFQFALWSNGSVLGRSSRCDFRVDHPSISRKHAKFHIAATGFTVTDLDSLNGTYVDNKKIDTSSVSPGQIVRFGNLSFALAHEKLDDDNIGPEEKTDPCETENKTVLPTSPAVDRLSRAQHRVLAELEQIYRYAPVGLFFVDRDLRYVRINEHLAAMNGKTIEEHLGRTPREVIPEVADQAEDILRRVIASGKPVLNLKLHGVTAAQPGVERFWFVNYWPLASKDGTILGVTAAIMEDETNPVAESNPATLKRLSLAQRRVFDFLLDGKSEKSIAELLELSPHTVHNHIRKIYRVFKVHSRPALLIRLFQSHG